jgi:drug/metabolite transporter (DMT)-like permease
MTLPIPQAPRASNSRGVLAMSAGMASFVANDAIVKTVSESLPSGQLICLRGVFATVLLLAVLAPMGLLRDLRLLWNRRVVLRAFLDACATLTYLTSLFHLPIGNATAINMATPLFITLFAVIAFKEKVGGARWLAIATGFTGVLLVVQPSGAAFNAYALLCLGGTLLHASRDLITRTIDRRIPSLLVTFSTAIAVTLLSGLWSLQQEWRPPTGRDLALLATPSVLHSIGYLMLTIAKRPGEISVIAPFRYAGLLFALLIGFVVWGDVPNAIAWTGIALLVGAGLYVLHSERSRARAELEPIPD